MTKHVSKSEKRDKTPCLAGLLARFVKTQLFKLLNSGFSGVLVSCFFCFVLFFFAVVRRAKNLVRRPSQNAAKNFHIGLQTCHLFVKACVRNLTPFQVNGTIYIFRSKLADINICPETSHPTPAPLCKLAVSLT